VVSSGTTRISVPPNASVLSDEEVLNCLGDDECWIPYIESRRKLRERQEDFLLSLKKTI
jgi:hypothetical protein